MSVTKQQLTISHNIAKEYIDQQLEILNNRIESLTGFKPSADAALNIVELWSGKIENVNSSVSLKDSYKNYALLLVTIGCYNVNTNVIAQSSSQIFAVDDIKLGNASNLENSIRVTNPKDGYSRGVTLSMIDEKILLLKGIDPSNVSNLKIVLLSVRGIKNANTSKI